MKINAINFTNIIINIAGTIEDNLDYLTELDTEIGDGDHGINMAKGFKRIKEKLSEADILDIGETLILSGKVLLNEIGGAMGPLYGGGLIKAGVALKGKNTIYKNDIYTLFSSLLESVKSLGGARVGDKTMVDTLEPFVIEYRRQSEDNEAVDSFREALAKAKEGMESTRDMISKVGRSSRLLERSKGHIDVGAASSYLILESFYNSLKSIMDQQNN